MSDGELLTRIRAMLAAIDLLIEVADQNSKYFTKSRLLRARRTLSEAEGSLAWHVEDAPW